MLIRQLLTLLAMPPALNLILMGLGLIAQSRRGLRKHVRH